MSEEEESKMKSEIISISLTKSLLEKLDEIQVSREFASRSEVIRHTLQSYLKDLEQQTRDENSIGLYLIGITYYGAKTKPIEINDILKDFTGDVVNTTRIKASQSINVVVYVLKTSFNIVRIFFEKLSGIKGLIDKKLFSLRGDV